MSQLTLTPEEDVLVLGAVRIRAAQFLSAYGVEDAELVSLLEKIQSQLTPAPLAEPEVVVEEPAAEEATEEVAEVVVEEAPAAE